MHIENLKYQTASTALFIDDWQLNADEHWGVFASHGQAAELLVGILTGELTARKGHIDGLPEKVACVSLHQQQQLLDEQIADDESEAQAGDSVSALLRAEGIDEATLNDLLQKTDLVHLQNRGFRMLSTGETRRLMLARALARQPQLLILDEPYAGLDVAHRAALTELLQSLLPTTQIIILTSREDELPQFISHIALFDEQKLTQTMRRDEWHNHPLLTQMQALSAQKSEQILSLLKQQNDNEYPDPRVELHNVRVAYTDTLIFEDVNWTIRAGEHWQLRGPNGAGKSTLLGLILGDHPQCYSNDITILGVKRGSGESIWDIKKNIGVVSSSLHLQYRVNCSALEVLLSGFFDSIGLYQKPSLAQIDQAKTWLTMLEMQALEKTGFRSLDYGQQRLLLVARALIKQPALLILDEPYQGLDYLNRKLVFHALNRIASSNITQLLYVTHHHEDSLDAIHHFADFVPSDNGGHQLQLSHA
ncbi:ATP-binding cassette domain-containing protein [Shewanella sp. C32]|uniref:ATP-binding cassette domain-containing protein n=1 Tax=Shewanella electrica TaxID=515560 RepID=A0ABT2FKL5_9GAMM|nr:ATP-binding cassette domain-containing protein [Shewanella electrica]MCH1924297.1 ATP-binding cassette domain-containing protein [Shewanella electrica]MCS4556200.1 ATP-binding cassette domain-containing protein [Shewanella electrica]